VYWTVAVGLQTGTWHAGTLNVKASLKHIAVVVSVSLFAVKTKMRTIKIRHGKTFKVDIG